MFPGLLVQILSVAVQVFLLLLLADFLGGLFHWSEDTLGDVDTPFWGPVFVVPSNGHHDHPTDMVKIPWMINNAPNVLAAVAVVLAFWLAGHLGWQIILLGILGAFNQQMHRFSHTPRHQLPRGIVALQKLRVLQTAPHHWRHHRDPHLTHYCVLTPWMNPVLDRLKIWRFFEFLLVPIFGAPRRPDLN